MRSIFLPPDKNNKAVEITNQQIIYRMANYFNAHVEIVVSIISIFISLILIILHYTNYLNSDIIADKLDKLNWDFSSRTHSIFDLFEIITIISSITPIFQLIILFALGLFTFPILISRFSPYIADKIYKNDPEDHETFLHTIFLTTAPLLLFTICLLQVISHWDPSRSLLGDWTLSRIIISLLSTFIGALFLLSSFYYSYENNYEKIPFIKKYLALWILLFRFIGAGFLLLSFFIKTLFK